MEQPNQRFRVIQRLTQYQKDAHGKQWYKDNMDSLDRRSGFGTSTFGDSGDFMSKKVNYDLYHNKINLADFEYVCKPWGEFAGELPAKMTNRDICSGKINAVLGIEMRRPFSWHVLAVNEDATTRKEQTETELMKQYVISQVMAGLGQKQQAMPPKEVRKYMLREHQDPAEILGNHLLNYLAKKEVVKEKFNKGLLHASLTAEEVYRVIDINGEPTLTVVNPLYFNFDKSPDNDYIEDSEWAVAEYRMTPSEVVGMFWEDLTKDDIHKIYNYNRGEANGNFWFSETYSSGFWTEPTDTAFTDGEIRVIHAVWKSLRKIGILEYEEEGNTLKKIVNETYRTLPGETIKWYWIPEVHEGYKIGNDIYVQMRPMPNQHKDLDNLHVCKLPYIGAVYDNTNAPITSLMDRMRPYQYLYNILMYRVELLMAKDKGKKVFFNMNAVPTSLGVDLKKFLYHMETDSIGFLNPNEEGKKFSAVQDIAGMVKEIDLSLASSIDQYMGIAQYIDMRCGEVIGVPKQLEGQVAEREAVSNVQQVLSLTSNKLEPFFQKHNTVKRNVLQALIECAKVSYMKNNPKKLSYILDDFSKVTLQLDPELLFNSTYGVFVIDSSRAEENKQLLEQLAHAAMQTGQVDFSTIMKVRRTESLPEAEEVLKEGEAQKKAEDLQLRTLEGEQQMKIQQDAHALKMEEMEFERNTKMMIEREKRKTQIATQAIFSAGFNEDKDINKDKVPDVLEFAEHILERERFAYQQEKDEKDRKSKQKQLAQN